MSGLTTAIGWFTRLPLPGRAVRDDLAGALGWLPFIGIVVAAVGGLTRAATLWLGDLPSAVLTVAACVAVTGAYHEDGLADTFDGLWGGWTVERRLEIMRDSRIGTYGASALGLALLLRVAVLAPLDAATTVRVLVLGHVTGRAVILPLLRWLPPARTDGALAPTRPPEGSTPWAIAGTTTVVVAVLAGGLAGAAAVAGGAVAAALLGAIARSRIGGITGDVLGGANQVAHIATMVVAAALLP